MERHLGLRYVRSAPSPPQPPVDSRPLLAEVAALPEDLKSRLLKSLVLLNKESIMEVTHLVSAVNPALGAELCRRADALEFTSILAAIQSEEAA